MTMDDSIKIAFDNSIKFIADITGDCPFGMYGYYNDCTDNCYPGKEPACWSKYFIDNQQDQQLKEVKNMLGIAEAEVIRRAITLYMNVVIGASVEVVERNEKDKGVAKAINGVVNYTLKQLQEKLKGG